MVFYEHVKILRSRRTNTWTFMYQAGTAIALFLSITMVNPMLRDHELPLNLIYTAYCR